MNELKVFNNAEFGEIRTITINNEPWFIGKDVAEVLGYARPTKAIQDKVDTDDKDEVPIQDSIGRMQSTPIINESGLYSLILSSKLPTAKKFKRWVTSEVLPTLRKTGSYSVNVANQDLNVQLVETLIKSHNELMEMNKTLMETNKIILGLVDKYKLNEPKIEKQDNTDYYIRSINVENKVCRDVYNDYVNYCRSNNITPNSNIDFSKRVRKALGYKSIPRRIKGDVIRVYTK